MTDQASAGSRTGAPFTVLVVVAFVILGGLLEAISGAVIWAVAGQDGVQDVTNQSEGTLMAAGVVAVVIGLLQIAFGLWLRGGSQVARLLVAVSAVVNIGFGIYWIATHGSHQLAEGLHVLLYAVVTLALLFNARANQYFAGH